MKKQTRWYLSLIAGVVALVGVACGSSEQPSCYRMAHLLVHPYDVRYQQEAGALR